MVQASPGRFQIFYRQGPDHLEYQPGFVAEAGDAIHTLEPKAANQLTDRAVLAKKEPAVRWCENASNHAATVSVPTTPFFPAPR